MLYEKAPPIKKFLLITLIFPAVFLVSVAYSQTNAVPTKKLVRWNMLSGIDKEIFLAVPDNSSFDLGKDFYLGSNGAARVDSLKTLVSSLNNSVFQIDFYEGQAEEIGNQLVKNFRNVSSANDEKPSKDVAGIEIKEQHIGDFIFTALRYRTPECFWKMQLFRVKTRLYVLKAVARDDGDLIVRSFFESVKLVSKDKSISPNLGGKIEDLNAAKLTLPPLVLLKSSDPSAAEKIYETKDLDKVAVVVRIKSGGLGLDRNYFYNSYNVIKVKVLLRADGTVGDVETITKVSKSLEKTALEDAKATKFIPAEKNGKPVSTYVTLQYSLTIG